MDDASNLRVELRCITCGRVLDGDPDEDPTGDAGQPICGECERNQNLFVMDVADGELDDRLDGDSDGDR